MLTLRQLLQNRLLLPIAGLLLLVAVIGLLIEWQPANQVKKHFDSMLTEISDRDWEDVTGAIDPSYKDRWGFDRERAIRESKEAMRHFFSLAVTAEDFTMDVSGDSATITARIRVQGSGTPIAEIIKGEVNSLAQPFTFEWKRASWKPWDWKLMSINQPQLEPAKYGVSL